MGEKVIKFLTWLSIIVNNSNDFMDSYSLLIAMGLLSYEALLYIISLLIKKLFGENKNKLLKLIISLIPLFIGVLLAFTNIGGSKDCANKWIIIIIAIFFTLMNLIAQKKSTQIEPKPASASSNEKSNKFNLILILAISAIMGITTGISCYFSENPLLFSVCCGFGVFALCFIVMWILCFFSVFPIIVFKPSLYFNDGDFISILFLISILVNIYEWTEFSKNNLWTQAFFLRFSLVVMLVLCLILLYRVICGMANVVTGKMNQQSKVSTVILFIIITLAVMSACLLFKSKTNGGLAWSNTSKKGPIEAIDIFYFTVITFSSVGYGDIIPDGNMMRLMACIISLFSVLSSVSFIESICNLFQNEEDSSRGFGNFKNILLALVCSIGICYLIIWVCANNYDAFFVCQDEWESLLYYTVITFTSVGYGDISANTLVAKICICFISMYGYLFSGIFLGIICDAFRIRKSNDNNYLNKNTDAGHTQN